VPRVPAPPNEIFFKELARYLGPSTAKTALKTFCDRSVGKSPEQLIASDVPKLMTALRPMLRTLLGVRESDQVLQQIVRELES
jgi:hypothetical protein